MTKYLETKTNSIEEAVSSVVLDEKFSITLPPVRGGKKLLNIEMGRAIRMLKDFGATKNDIRNALSSRSFRFQNANGEMFLIQKEEVELGEGYESEVLKVLKDADIDGYFKMGKLYVSRRDAKDAKKALDDSDEITKLPKMVMEDERMKKLTKRQRQALARVQAKPKSQVSLPKMPDFMKLKKEENEMDIVDTIRNVVEKKLDPVNKDAVKKKFDDRKDKDIDNDGDVDSTDKYLHTRRKAISKAIKNERVTDVAVDQAKRDLKHAKLKKATADVKNEVYDIGKDYAQHTLEVTPGQDKKDVDKMLNTAYTKNQSMRETLAKVWGLGEGKSPFQKEEEKPLTKTMTGQKPTKVEVEPKMEKK